MWSNRPFYANPKLGNNFGEFMPHRKDVTNIQTRLFSLNNHLTFILLYVKGEIWLSIKTYVFISQHVVTFCRYFHFKLIMIMMIMWKLMWAFRNEFSLRRCQTQFDQNSFLLDSTILAFWFYISLPPNKTVRRRKSILVQCRVFPNSRWAQNSGLFACQS